MRLKAPAVQEMSLSTDDTFERYDLIAALRHLGGELGGYGYLVEVDGLDECCQTPSSRPSVRADNLRRTYWLRECAPLFAQPSTSQWNVRVLIPMRTRRIPGCRL
jgi:hypothetical protein